MNHKKKDQKPPESEPYSQSYLVHKAEEITEDIKGTEIETDQASQLRNVLNIACEESEVPVLINFIRYQAAKDTTKKFWRPIYEKVIGVLQRIEAENKDKAEQKAIDIRNFFGYMVRHYTYLRFSKNPKRGQSHRRKNPKKPLAKLQR